MPVASCVITGTVLLTALSNFCPDGAVPPSFVLPFSTSKRFLTKARWGRDGGLGADCQTKVDTMKPPSSLIPSPARFYRGKVGNTRQARPKRHAGHAQLVFTYVLKLFTKSTPTDPRPRRSPPPSSEPAASWPVHSRDQAQGRSPPPAWPCPCCSPARGPGPYCRPRQAMSGAGWN